MYLEDPGNMAFTTCPPPQKEGFNKAGYWGKAMVNKAGYWLFLGFGGYGLRGGVAVDNKP